MEAFDEKYVLPAFGLHNVQAICHFNAMLQALLSCPSVVKAILTNREYFLATRTGTAMLAMVEAAQRDPGAVGPHSGQVLQALLTDLRERRPNARLGASNESASEDFVMFLDMMETPVQTKPEANLGDKQTLAAR